MNRSFVTVVAALATAAVFTWLPAERACADGRAFTPRDLVMLDRLSDPQLSPDGTQVVYDLRSTDLAKNRGVHATWLLDTATGTQRRLAISDKHANSARWSPDGRYIYFLAPQGGTEQLWRADRTGSHARAVTSLPLDVQAYRIAPDGKTAVVALAVFADCAAPQCTAQRQAEMAKSKATGRLYTRLFVRHWDTWSDHTVNHLFAVPIDESGRGGSAVSLMTNVDGDVPNKPFGDENDFAISPDSRSVVYSVRIAGTTEAWSTNFDLYEVSMNGTGTRNLTQNNPAWDAGPVFSPDGTQLAYRAQKRPGFESDRYGIMVMDLKSGTTREVDPAWDRSASDLAWSHDGRTLYASADDMQDHKLFAIDPATGSATAVTGAGTVESYQIGTNTIVFAQSSLQSPAQLFRVRGSGSNARQLTHVDAQKLAGIALSTPERFTFTGWNGDTVHGWVTKPYGYVGGRKYPVAFLIHGGPQGSWENGWSYRWNPQTYAGRGYAVVQIDPHASTGYGQAFVDAVSQHWGDRPLEDLQKGWTAALAQYQFLDGGRACALGASYGGYMVYWIAGNWNTPWKCLVDHDGVFDNRMMGYATEELWFSEWENGGTPWDHVAQYERFNPINYVANWRVPMLVVHSDNDFRIPVDQGIAAFTALQMRGIPSEFLNFPDENHWVLKPQNSLMWHNTVDDWLDRWLR